jgi:cyclophilin family peptidyl-prolyl cis-trans isomerase
MTMRESNRPARFAVCLLLLLCTSLAASQEPAPRVEQDYFLPPVGLEQGWYARIETSHGRILARLLPEQAPQAVAHFAGLAEGRLTWVDSILGEEQKGRYYDEIEVDLAKAGDRFEAGGLDGDPSRTAPQLFISPAEGKGPINFSGGGRLGMTAAYGARISGVKFFVTASARPVYNARYPCFGIVVEGRDVVQRITEVKTHPKGRPIDPVRIDKIRIFAVGDPEPLPEPVSYRPGLEHFETRDSP